MARAQSQLKAKARAVGGGVGDYGQGQQTGNRQSVMVGDVGGPQNAVDRLIRMEPGFVQGPDPEWEWTLANVRQATSQIDGQMDRLDSELQNLRSLLRHHLPDCLFSEDKCEGAAYEGYIVAGNLDSPTLQALAHLANRVTDIRRSVAFLSNNLVL